MTEHLPAARYKSQNTYDRRRARRAAETLAQILPSRWDDKTRQIVATLAVTSAPSGNPRVDAMLKQAFDNAIPAADWEAAKLAAFGSEQIDDVPAPLPDGAGWDRIGPDGTEDIHEAMGAELERLGLMTPHEFTTEVETRDA